MKLQKMKTLARSVLFEKMYSLKGTIKEEKQKGIVKEQGN